MVSKKKKAVLASINDCTADFYINYVISESLDGSDPVCIICNYGVTSSDDTSDIIFDEIRIPSMLEGVVVKSLNNIYCISNPLEERSEHNEKQVIRVKKLIIPDTVNFIQDNAFYDSEYVKSVVWPQSCNTIGVRCFSLSLIEEVIIPEGVTRINEKAFASCKKLTRITLPKSCKVILDNAFRDSCNLKEINISNNIIRIGPGAFCNTGIEKFDWPVACKIINSRCLAFCKELKSITVKGNIEYIDSSFIEGCASLKVLDLSGMLSICEVDSKLGFYNILSNIPETLFPLYGYIVDGEIALD